LSIGKVSLIGAGPGEPGLLTLKGRDCLAQADVIVYDYLANPVLLGHGRSDAEQIYVGKNRGCHSLPQDDINQLLAAKARAGLRVARLKGGDPYVFGRGGEEAAFLHEQGIPFEVVPGVTAGFAAAAYAGIPLTHRDVTTSLALLTGHERPERKLSSLDWQTLATGIGTLIFYMGMTNLETICAQLMAHGRPATTPVAVIQWATLPRQKTLTAPLAEIAARVVAAGIEPPAVIIIGEVVGYREELRWYDNLPLFGKRFLITRPREQAQYFVDLLQGQGAETICIPTIEIAPPESWQDLDQALEELNRYQGVILTSANGVSAFFERMRTKNLDLRALAGVEIIAVGPKTAQSIAAYGLKPDLIPADYRAEGVLTALLARGVEGQRFLYPRTEIARDVLRVSLTAAGAQVDAPVVYRTIAPQNKTDMIRHLLAEKELDAICFSSSSTFENFSAMLGAELKHLQGRAAFFSIGPLTSKTIRQHGFKVALEPQSSTLDDLVAAMVDYYTTS